MFTFLKRIKDPVNFGKGANQTQPNPLKDYSHAEVAGATQPAVWIEKKPEDFMTYPIKNQSTSSACVAFKYSKQAEIDELSENGQYRILSPRSIYPFGFLPGGGMNDYTASSIVVNKGITLESLLPSDGMNESQMENASDYLIDAKQIALVYKPDKVIFAQQDIETIASILYTYQQQNIKKGVGIIVQGFNNGTWLSQYPQPTSSGANWYHGVVATDFGLINGQKFISIDNSWGTNVGMGGKQFLSESYLSASGMLTAVDYTINLPDDWRDNATTLPKPSYQWNIDLTIGASNNDVLMLQRALQYLGMFPPDDNVIKATGYFGGLTRAGVQEFQIKYNIQPSDGYFGPITRNQFNTMFK